MFVSWTFAINNLRSVVDMTFPSWFYFAFSSQSVLTLTMTDRIPVASAPILSVPGIQKNSKYSFIEISLSRFSPILTKLYSISNSFADSFLKGIQNFYVPPTCFKAIGISRWLALASKTDFGHEILGGSITPINITCILFFFSMSSNV